jgi:hypothetical protein
MNMTKEQYLQQRNSGEMSYELFWEYYREHCETPLVKTFQEFVQAFNQFHSIFPVLQYESVFRYYDNKFNVTKITDIKNSKTIRYE